MTPKNGISALFAAMFASFAGIFGARAKREAQASPVVQELADVASTVAVHQIGAGPDAAEQAAIGAVSSGAAAAIGGSSAGTPLAQSVPLVLVGAADAVAGSGASATIKGAAGTVIELGGLVAEANAGAATPSPGN